MSRDVEEWCRVCAVCTSRRNPVPRSQIRAPLEHIAASYPVERNAMDLMASNAMSRIENQDGTCLVQILLSQTFLP